MPNIAATSSQSGAPLDVRSNEAPHNSALDGIRGLAVLAVLIAHAAQFYVPVTHFTHIFLTVMIFGWSGVDLFFVLSGYLITGILLRTRAATNRATSFYARRTLRIFPIYYLTLAFIFIGAHYWQWISSTMVWKTPVDKIFCVLYLQNWLILLHNAPSRVNILGHFWSLAVEEQFYLLWPWLVWAVTKRSLLRVCIAGTLASLALRIALVTHYGPIDWIHFVTPTRGSGLLVGSALAVLAAEGRISKRLLSYLAGSGAAILAFIAVVDRIEFGNTTAGPYMVTIGDFALPLLFGALVGSSQYLVPGLTKICTLRSLRTLGKYSYGMYVYHLPLYILLSYLMNEKLGIPVPERLLYAVLCSVIGFAATFALAWLSYNFFEAKLLAFKDRFKPVFAGR